MRLQIDNFWTNMNDGWRALMKFLVTLNRFDLDMDIYADLNLLEEFYRRYYDGNTKKVRGIRQKEGRV